MYSVIIKHHNLYTNLLLVSGWNFYCYLYSQTYKRFCLSFGLYFFNIFGNSFKKVFLCSYYNKWQFFFNLIKITPTMLVFYVFYLNRFSLLFFYSRFIKAMNRQFSVINFNWFCTIYLIGLGFRVFIHKRLLYIRLGYSKIIKFTIPRDLVVLVRRRSILKCISCDKISLSHFILFLCSLRKFNKYKGKGIFLHKNYSFIKLKTGKRQQFF